jgi:hypothetical protein
MRFTPGLTVIRPSQGTLTAGKAKYSLPWYGLSKGKAPEFTVINIFCS